MLVALGDGSGHVSLGDPIRRKPQTQCRLRGEVTALLSSKDYGLLICGSTSEAEGGSGRVVCYDTASSGPELPTIRTMQTPPFKQNPIASGYSLAFAMASKHEAVVTRQGVDVKLVTLDDGKEMHVFDALGKEDEHAFCASVDSSLLACWKHTSDSSQIDFFHLDEIKSADVEEEKEADPEQGGKTPEGTKPEEETRVANAHVPFDLLEECNVDDKVALMSVWTIDKKAGKHLIAVGCVSGDVYLFEQSKGSSRITQIHQKHDDVDLPLPGPYLRLLRRCQKR